MLNRSLVPGLLLALPAIAAGQPAPASPPASRPNVVVILVDDLRWDELGATGVSTVRTPNIDRLAREGVLFRNSFVTTPLCSPSRASLLTGQYAHTHGITDNTNRSAASRALVTFPLLLQKHGYETAFVGKWHMGNDDAPRPGFNRWVSFRGQGTYTDPEFNDDGTVVKRSGYITDLLNQAAVDFVRRPRSGPFMLYVAHKAIHPETTQADDGSTTGDSELFIPATRHAGLYADVPLQRRPNWGRQPTGKPALQRQIADLPPLGPATVTRDSVIRQRQRTLLAVDDGVAAIRAALEQTGQLDNTVFVFTGDNGYFYGEHGLNGVRRLAYEESARVPLLVRYPPLIDRGTERDQMVLNLDLAPTVLSLAGVAIPEQMEGRSLTPLFKDAHAVWRSSFLIEYYSDRVVPRILSMGYKAVRTERWKYIHYLELEGMDELYDLAADPYETSNVIDRPDAAAPLAQLKDEMRKLLAGSR